MKAKGCVNRMDNPQVNAARITEATKISKPFIACLLYTCPRPVINNARITAVPTECYLQELGSFREFGSQMSLWAAGGLAMKIDCKNGSCEALICSSVSASIIIRVLALILPIMAQVCSV